MLEFRACMYAATCAATVSFFIPAAVAADAPATAPATMAATAPATQTGPKIAADMAVKIDYTLTGPDGKVLDTSTGKKPLAYLQGHHNIVIGLEKQLEGHAVGDHLHVTLQPEEAYGNRNEKLVQTIDKSTLQGAPELKVGMHFRASNNAGQSRMFTVTNIDGDKITIDGNHPLAGKALTFDVTVIEVRPATPEEISAGHLAR